MLLFHALDDDDGVMYPLSPPAAAQQ